MSSDIVPQLTADEWLRRVFQSSPPEFQTANTTLTSTINQLLKTHRLMTGCPGVACAVYVNPCCWNDNLKPNWPNSAQSGHFGGVLSQLQRSIFQQGKVIFCGADGFNDLDSQTPLDCESAMMIASMTKLITSMLFGRLMSFDTSLIPNHPLNHPIVDLDTTFWELLSFGDFFGWKVLLRVILHLFLQHYPFNALTDPTSLHVDGFNPIALPQRWLLVLSQVHDSNKHAVDALVAESIAHLTEFEDRFSKMTLQNLMSHTAGIRDYDFKKGEHQSSTAHPTSLSAVLAFLFDPLLDNETDTSCSPPKRSFMYTTFGYSIVQVALELAMIRFYFRCYQQMFSICPVDLAHLQAAFPFECVSPSFPQLVQAYITTPLGLPNLSHEFWRTARSVQRATEYSQSWHMPSLSSTESFSPLQMPSGQLLRPVIANKSNVGGCLVANVRSLALFGGALTHCFSHSGSYLPPITNHHSLACFVPQSYIMKASSLHVPSQFHSGDDRPAPPTPGIRSYGLGCLNLHLDALQTASVTFNRLFAGKNKPTLQTISSQYPYPTAILQTPTIFHSGRAVGSSGQLVIALSDGIVVSVLGNVGLTDLKACGLDVACAVKQFIVQQIYSNGVVNR